MKDFRIFCTAMGTNAGCQNIIEIMQGKRSALDAGAVLGELEKRHDARDVQYVKHLGMKTDMEALVTKQGLQDIAGQVYRSADPSKLSSERVHRGLGMTKEGLVKLLALQKSGTPVKSDYFLSCSKNAEIAHSFAETYSNKDEEKVLLQIRGYSNMALRSYLPYNEKETLFTPHATFEIEKIFRGANSGHVIVRLTEIPSRPNAVSFPS